MVQKFMGSLNLKRYMVQKFMSTSGSNRRLLPTAADSDVSVVTWHRNRREDIVLKSVLLALVIFETVNKYDRQQNGNPHEASHVDCMQVRL